MTQRGYPVTAQRSGCDWEEAEQRNEQAFAAGGRAGYGACDAEVKGHASNEYNNRCDQLAVAESQKFKQLNP